MGLIIVTTTVATREDAQRLARAAVEQRLVACAQISAIDSCYRWDGMVCESPEFRLVLKTRDALYPALEHALLALHPYQLPAIHAVPVCAAHGPYADWVLAETDAPASGPTQPTAHAELPCPGGAIDATAPGAPQPATAPPGLRPW